MNNGSSRHDDAAYIYMGSSVGEINVRETYRATKNRNSAYERVYEKYNFDEITSV